MNYYGWIVIDRVVNITSPNLQIWLDRASKGTAPFDLVRPRVT